MENDLIDLFTGSDIETKYISSLLRENNIHYIMRNTYEESINAGWAFGSSNCSTTIKIYEKDLGKAKKIIMDYKNMFA